MIVWFTGPRGAGKTTTAEALQQALGGVVLDGDQMRASMSLDLDFSPRGRHEHNLRVARLARELAKQMPVFVSVIAPFAATREAITAICAPVWVYLKNPSRLAQPGEVYEEPSEYLTFNTAVTPTTAIVDALRKQVGGLPWRSSA